MLREKVKLAILMGSFFLCLGSLLTSQKSFQMGPRDLPILEAQVMRYCKSIYTVRNRCNLSNSNNKISKQKTAGINNNYDCPQIIQQAKQCEIAVKQAYKQINRGGCPYQLRDVTLCELERCGGYHGISVLRTSSQQHQQQQQPPMLDALEGCMHHCDTVRKRLDRCIYDNVQRHLHKYDIQIES